MANRRTGREIFGGGAGGGLDRPNNVHSRRGRTRTRGGFWHSRGGRARHSCYHAEEAPMVGRMTGIRGVLAVIAPLLFLGTGKGAISHIAG